MDHHREKKEGGGRFIFGGHLNDVERYNQWEEEKGKYRVGKRGVCGGERGVVTCDVKRYK